MREAFKAVVSTTDPLLSVTVVKTEHANSDKLVSPLRFKFTVPKPNTQLCRTPVHLVQHPQLDVFEILENEKLVGYNVFVYPAQFAINEREKFHLSLHFETEKGEYQTVVEYYEPKNTNELNVLSFNRVVV